MRHPGLTTHPTLLQAVGNNMGGFGAILLDFFVAACAALGRREIEPQLVEQLATTATAENVLFLEKVLQFCVGRDLLTNTLMEQLLDAVRGCQTGLDCGESTDICWKGQARTCATHGAETDCNCLSIRPCAIVVCRSSEAGCPQQGQGQICLCR